MRIDCRKTTRSTGRARSAARLCSCRSISNRVSATGFKRFDLSLEVSQRIGRVHVEQGTAAGAPASPLIMKEGRRVANHADGFEPLHVAPFDRLKADVDAGKRGQHSGLEIAAEGNR